MLNKFLKLIYILLIFLTYLFFVNNTFAFQFEKISDNPLSISYTNNYVNQLQVNIFKEGDIYKGIFVINKAAETFYSLGYFESGNSIDWQMKKEILNTGSDLSNPSVLKTSTGYIMFISRFDNNSVYRIYSSNCDVDFNCSPNLIPVIIPDLGNISENNGVFAGHPFKQDNRTYLFFGAWGGDGFKLKLAYSDDLINWKRCPNSFLYGGDGPYPYQENNDLYLFFHRSDSTGIKFAKTTLPLNCNSVFIDQGYLLIKDKPYDQKHLIFPSVLNENGGLKLFYSGLGVDNIWHLVLAKSPEKTPVIIIPGLMASWNREAIVHNSPQPQTIWQLNPIVKEYSGIIASLKNLGYEENKNLFVFVYDWRKPILNIVDDLNKYINNLPISNFSIIGHSLGGLVGRIYAQKYSNTNIDKLITVGSPHYGASQSYKIVESGEIDRFNDYLWLAVKMIIGLNKNNLETDRQTLSRLFPVIKDIFPVFNFLKKNGIEITTADMKIKNELLAYYNSNLTNEIHESYWSHVITIAGEKGDTLKGFNVENQTIIDKLLDNYPDGRPHSTFSEIGDFTILSSSAGLKTPVILNLEHGELIYKKESIKKIFDLLNIKYLDSQIMEGKGTIIDSSLIFLIKSPAIMEVVFNGQTYTEQDGMIFIENAQSGDYQLKIEGIEKGNYEVIVGQIGQNNDIWNNIYGETTASQTDYYYIHYNSDSPQNILVDDLYSYLKIKNYQFKDLNNLTKIFDGLIKKKDFIGLGKLENYKLSLNNQEKANSRQIRKELEKTEENLNLLKRPIDPVVLEQIVKRANIIKKELDKKNYLYCIILQDTIRGLLKIVKK